MPAKLAGKCHAAAHRASGRVYIDEPSSADGATLRASLLAWALDPTLPGTAVLQQDAEYQYDVWGNRTQKIVDADGAGASDAVATRYAYDGWNPGKPSPRGTENFDFWATFDDESSLTSREIQGEDFDEHLARIQDSNAYFYLADHLNSIRAVLDDTDTPVDEIEYDAFANITSESNPGDRGLYAYTGREFDVETQLQYNRARYYDATTGRWISQDPLGFDAGGIVIFIGAETPAPITLSTYLASDETRAGSLLYK